MKTTIIATLLCLFVLCNAQSETNKPDVMTLNFALSLEYLGRALYRQFNQTFSVADAQAAGYTAYDYSQIVEIGLDEIQHVERLQQVIPTLGGEFIQPCTYNFPFGNNFNAFLNLSRTVENTCVGALDGGIAMLNTPALFTAAATFATVEARHASFLNLITGLVPFPSAFDTPLNATQVLAIASPLFASCPSYNNECFGILNTNATVCSGHGSCAYKVCTCDAGFTGPDCSSKATQAPKCQ
ncbi:RDS1 [Acrasis kona]|uniref:RDS1 n=1 Tax=Acrasis kona TaxID=1008807 RepID=A0AAW2YT49_9EUKA